MTLFIVATPIGNRKDITIRALETLNEVDLILCEDTRRSGVFLSDLNIEKPLLSFHEHNEIKRIPEIILKLRQNKKIALISDAGTPLISDPGFKLVRQTLAEGLSVTTVPGPSAITSAISISGLPSDKFLFVGYLPKTAGKKANLIQKLVEVKKILPQSLIFFESPFRIKETLLSLSKYFPNSQVSVQRELTKKHEEIYTGPLERATETLTTFKGEFTIVLN